MVLLDWHEIQRMAGSDLFLILIQFHIFIFKNFVICGKEQMMLVIKE
jgi:hypothetical protein